jgi:predicted RNA-binding protein YlqC (UPF0109 family)
MSDENRPPDLVQYGRPLRKRPRGPVAQPANPSPAVVGPVDAPAGVERVETVVRPGPSEAAPLSPRPVPAPRAARVPGPQDDQLRGLVEMMARGLVDRPDDVAVEVLQPGDDAVLELHVHPDDLGHVIGKQGRTARSMRLTLGAAASRMGRNADLEIAD